MFAYFKSEPTEYVLGYRNGKVFRQGAGKAFWYWRPSASIVLVPTATTDGLFVLNETTGNFQAVTLQGQITYRVVAPQILAGLLNFTIDPNTKQYLSEDPAKLQQRIVNIVQTHTRHELQQLSLEEALRSAEAIAQRVFERMRQDATIGTLGVECLSLFYTAIKASPEMTKALEAEYRETLQKRADQAIYSRRADAVEQERKIKQNELSTSVDLEQRRQQLVELEGANARARAEFEAEATRIRLTPFQALEPRLVLALAFRDMAANADKIGNLTITTEVLEELLQARG
jgi:SPFH domain / Band 7 family